MMKNILFLLLASASWAEVSIFDEGEMSTKTPSSPMATPETMIDLKATQQIFLNEKFSGNENILSINFIHGKTFRIRTRYAMSTTIILDEDRIIDAILGDSVGFEKVIPSKDKYDLSNIIIVKPKMIGIDTSLTIIGESGRLYSFYLYSTDHNSTKYPNLVVFVSEKHDQITRIPIRNLEKEAFELAKAEKEAEEAKKKISLEADDYLLIGDEVNRLRVKIDEIERGYAQEGEDSLKAYDIFNDNKFTYFRYDRNRADSRFPAVYRVVDGYDNPVNTRVVGNYIIAETLSNRFTLRAGEKWVCVKKGKK
ncbi:TrbG/VirB9 family P-type conjugative transfer protein [Wolinella succinogenes]|uniref:TrbG/VirB9 family P-type conjugative transfer protein n=1 Tax=Wolinella succinogenes TaxID=844 RepID=UPI002FCBB38A